MLLKTAAFLCALGFGMWILGSVFDKTGIAVIGGVLIVGVGAAGTVNSLQVVDGETRVHNNSTNTTTITHQTSAVSTPANLPLGPLIMLGGGLMVIQTINDAADTNRRIANP